MILYFINTYLLQHGLLLGHLGLSYISHLATLDFYLKL